MTDASRDELADLVSLTEARLREMAQSGAMRQDPYRLSLAVQVAVVQLLAAIACRMRAGEMSKEDRDATRAALVRAAGQEGKVLVRQLHRRTLAMIALGVAGAFFLGMGVEVARSYATNSYAASGPVVLPGDAILCQASGLRLDPEGRKFYPALNLRLEAGRR